MRLTALSLALLLTALHVEAQSLTVRPDRTYLKALYADAGGIIISPAEWDMKDWGAAAGICGAAGLCIALADEPVTEAVRKNMNHGTETAALLLEPLGDGLWTLPGLAAFYGYSRLSGYNKGTAVSLAALQSFLTAGTFTHVLKQVFHRHRPNTGDGPHTWDGPSVSQYHLSFPSGHTTAAFSIASVFATAYHESPWIPALSYTLAAGTGLSRIHDHKHWLADVFIGAVIGTCTGRYIVKAWEKRTAGRVSAEINGYTFRINYLL